MTQITIEKSWQMIVDSTRLMEQNADDENWAAVSELATHRHHSITRHFNHFPVGPDTADFYQQHLSQFLKTEQALQKLTVEARKTAMKAGLIHNNNRKAINAYREG